MSSTSISPALPFEEAANLYLQMRTLDVPGRRGDRRIGGILEQNTEISYAQYCASLSLFFAGMRLSKIHSGNLREYQKARLSGAKPFVRYRRPQDAKPRRMGSVELAPLGKTPCPAQPKKVNQELCLLKMILERAGLWTDQLDKEYEPLLEPQREIPRALTPEEQHHWLATAASRAEWEVVYWYSILAIDTLMSTDELRGLRLGDCNLLHRTVTVQRGKCRSRARTIQLANADVLWALEKLLERAEAAGARDYQHYLFPFRTGGRYGQWEVTRPMTVSGLKRPWSAVRAASGLTWFRPYDPRHTGITRLAEAGVPIAVIKDRAGHITDKMSAHYTHVSESVQRQWMMHAGGYRVGVRIELEPPGAMERSTHQQWERRPPQPVRSCTGPQRGTLYPQQRSK
jgi:integrase